MDSNNLEYVAYQYAEKKKFVIQVKQAFMDGYKRREKEPLLEILKENYKGCKTEKEAIDKANLDAAHSGAFCSSKFYPRYKDQFEKNVAIKTLIDILENQKE